MCPKGDLKSVQEVVIRRIDKMNADEARRFPMLNEFQAVSIVCRRIALFRNDTALDSTPSIVSFVSATIGFRLVYDNAGAVDCSLSVFSNAQRGHGRREPIPFWR